jgi:hypothetical protein
LVAPGGCGPVHHEGTPMGLHAEIPIGSAGLEARTVRKPLENKAFPPKCTLSISADRG